MSLKNRLKEIDACSMKAHEIGIHELEDECSVVNQFLDTKTNPNDYSEEEKMIIKDQLEEIEYEENSSPNEWFEKRLKLYKDY